VGVEEEEGESPVGGLVYLFVCIFRSAQEIITVQKSFVNPSPLVISNA